jgi:hypothetical protein
MQCSGSAAGINLYPAFALRIEVECQNRYRYNSN